MQAEKIKRLSHIALLKIHGWFPEEKEIQVDRSWYTLSVSLYLNVLTFKLFKSIIHMFYLHCAKYVFKWPSDQADCIFL